MMPHIHPRPTIGLQRSVLSKTKFVTGTPSQPKGNRENLTAKSDVQKSYWACMKEILGSDRQKLKDKLTKIVSMPYAVSSMYLQSNCITTL